VYTLARSNIKHRWVYRLLWCTPTFYQHVKREAWGGGGRGQARGTHKTLVGLTHTHTRMFIHTHKYIHTHIIPVCEAQGGRVCHGVGHDNAHSTVGATHTNTNVYIYMCVCVYIYKSTLTHFVPARKAQRAREAQVGEKGGGVTGSGSRGRARGTHTTLATLATQTLKHSDTSDQNVFSLNFSRHTNSRRSVKNVRNQTKCVIFRAVGFSHTHTPSHTYTIVVQELSGGSSGSPSAARPIMSDDTDRQRSEV
jgi:hypothetical protein